MQSSRSSGFNLVEVMIATVSLVVGLLSVVGTTTTTSMLRKRGVEEDRVFQGLVSRAEWIRGQLYSDTPLQNQCDDTLTGAGTQLTVNYIMDENGDGQQDFPSSPGDNATPIVTCVIEPAAPFNNASRLVQVTLTASWYGVSGQRTNSIDCLIGNRSGYKPD